jgi:hypothetical protein
MVFSRGSKSKDTSDGISTDPSSGRSPQTDQPVTSSNGRFSKTQLKRATRTRKIFALLTSLLLFFSVIFLILVEIGNTNAGKIRSDIYFLRLDLSQIVPSSIPDAVLLNTIAQTLGLHDYYQTGLWNYCEGYVSEGITSCAKPQALYWFNPIEILVNQLVAGASCTFPLVLGLKNRIPLLNDYLSRRIGYMEFIHDLLNLLKSRSHISSSKMS